MLNKRNVLFSLFVLLSPVAYLSGCADSVKNMQPVPLDRIVTVPEKGKSMVIFSRPSIFGVKTPSSIFEIKNDSLSLIGIITAEEKIAFQLSPGKHLFMIVSENADFMAAELNADKTYYARIAPIMGNWVGHFSLRPVHRKTLYSPSFINQQKNCTWVEKTPASDSWIRSNLASIQSKQKTYYTKWINDGLSESFKLLPKDWK